MPLTARQRQTLLWTVIGALFVWALIALGPVLTPFAAAAILAYVLAPLVAAMQRHRVPRIVAVVLAISLALVGLLIFIPFIGFAIGMIFAAIAGMLQLGPLAGLVSVAIIYGIAQVVESVWLTPRLVGERIGPHPVAVIFALMAFGALFGFVGVLLALPLAAITAVGLRRLQRAWLDSDFFGCDQA